MYLRSVSARERFTREDFEFVVEALTEGSGDAAESGIWRLLGDAGEADRIFDHPRLLAELLDPGSVSKVSVRFFLYVILRHCLREMGLDHREVADYLAERLQGFVREDAGSSGGPEVFGYEIDLQEALSLANGFDAYRLHCFGGDRSLFLTGLYPEFLRYRCDRRGAPDLRFYEETGRDHYRTARDHPLAGEFDERETLDTLTVSFPVIRRALNQIGSEYLAMSA